MSFSASVKDEMLKNIPSARHCQIAETAGYILNIGKINETGIIFETENELLIRRIGVLLEKAYNILVGYTMDTNGIKIRYELVVNNSNEVSDILMSLKYKNGDNTVDGRIIQAICCKRAYLQAVFMSIGSVTDPDKGYHLEFVSSSKERLLQVRDLINDFDIAAKLTQRKNQYVLYIKEGQAIVDLLNVMGAHVALMNMENSIIMKDFRNGLNRRVNCEAANLIKSANAGSRQKSDIELIRDKYGFDNLPDNLREIAILRIENPEASLSELSDMTNPHVGKSGINHRLRKLSELAETLK